MVLAQTKTAPPLPQSLTEGKYPPRRARLLFCTILINQIFLQEKPKLLISFVRLPLDEG